MPLPRSAGAHLERRALGFGAVEPVVAPIAPGRIVAVGDTDTRLKWAVRVARALLGGSCDPRVLAVGADAPTTRQLRDVGIAAPVERVADLELEAHLGGVDVIVACTLMYRLSAILEHVGAAADAGPRPVVVTGYAGVVYEGHEMGALWRAGADVVVCNTASDRERFARLYREFGLDERVLVRGGFGILSDRLAASDVVRAIRTGGGDGPIVFAVQPDVPATRGERLALLEGWAEYARRRPDRRVVIKLRSRPDERTTHREPHHYERLAATHAADLPANLEFTYGLMEDVLVGARALVTVSSTAAIEALGRGIPTVILCDFGVRDGYGTSYFLGSGLLRTMSDVIADDVPTPDERWLRRNGFDDDDALDGVVRRVAELLADDGPGPPAPRFFDERRTPFVIERARARMSEPERDASSRSTLRRFVNGPLRRAYLRLDGWLAR